MVPGKMERRIVRRIPNPGTTTGAGDILIDDKGGRWVELDPLYPVVDQTAPPTVGTLIGNGKIRF